MNVSNDLQGQYETRQALFQAQPDAVQHCIEAQGRQIAEALTGSRVQVHFVLPDVVRVEVDSGMSPLIPVPPDYREQTVRGVKAGLMRNDILAAVCQRLDGLEREPPTSVSVGASLTRYATAEWMIRQMLPTGRSGASLRQAGEQMAEMAPALTDHGSGAEQETGPRSLEVPLVPAARRHLVPQWVAVDGDQLLVHSAAEAQACMESMRHFMAVLGMAAQLAPYAQADPEYQRKHDGMHDQITEQGWAMGRYWTCETIRIIRQRAEAHNLNRGLSLSLPYFDDQALEMKKLEIEVIPAGRIMFIPALVWRSAREEQDNIAQDRRLSPGTRAHLLVQLKMLEQAFAMRPSALDTP